MGGRFLQACSHKRTAITADDNMNLYVFSGRKA